MVDAPKKKAVAAVLLTIGIFFLILHGPRQTVVDNLRFELPALRVLHTSGSHGLGLYPQRLCGSAWAIPYVNMSDYGKRKGMRFLQVLALSIFLAVGGLISFMNDAEHLTKHGQAATIPIYVIVNDLYMFFFALLTYRTARSVKMKAKVLSTLFFVFLIAHFVFCLLCAYVPGISL